MTKTIKLKWVTVIKDRLNEPEFKEDKTVQDFIRPILLYGQAEERRITKALK